MFSSNVSPVHSGLSATQWLDQRKRLTATLLIWVEQHVIPWAAEGQKLSPFEFVEGNWRLSIKAPTHSLSNSANRRAAVRELRAHLDIVFWNTGIVVAKRRWQLLRTAMEL
jgi:hypothetical protein